VEIIFDLDAFLGRIEQRGKRTRELITHVFLDRYQTVDSAIHFVNRHHRWRLFLT